MNVDVPLTEWLSYLAGRTGGRRPLWCHQSRGRVARSRMPIVSQARHLSKRRNANACALTITYPELAVARLCKLVVLGLEVGGRFSREAAAFLRQLAKARARESPARLRPAVQRASLHRWTGMLAVAAQRALAHSLLELPLAGADECDGAEPPLGDLLADARDARQPPPRRVTCALLEGGVLASSRVLRVT